MASFNEAMSKVGNFGRYQKFIYLLVCFCHILTGFHMVIAVFLTGTPDHRCALPNYPNDTYEIQSEYHQHLINLTIPENEDKDVDYDQCHVDINRTKTKCSKWVYSTEVYKSTFTSEQNLVCDDKLKTSHAQLIFFGGVFVGAFALGALSDGIGRRKTLCLSFVGLLASGLGVAWSPNFIVFCVLRFLVGFSCAGVIMTSYVLGIEIVGSSGRLWTGIIIQIWFSIGFVILSGIGYAFKHWKYIEITCSVPIVLYLSYWWIIPESPRWLMSQGRVQEATQVLQKIAKYNGSKSVIPDDILSEDNTEKPKQARLWHLMSSRTLFIRTSIIFFNWMVVSMVYYGLSLNTGNLGGDFYLNFFLSGIVEIPAYILCLLLLERTGRKSFHAFCMIFGGLACISTIFTTLYADESLSAVGVTLAMLGKVGASAAFAVIYIWSAELYPTIARNAAMGASSGFARLGGMIAPYIADLNKVLSGDVGKALPLLVFGGASVVAGFISLWLPETVGRALPETIEDSENFTKSKSKAEQSLDVFVNKGFEDEKSTNDILNGSKSTNGHVSDHTTKM